MQGQIFLSQVFIQIFSSYFANLEYTQSLEFTTTSFYKFFFLDSFQGVSKDISGMKWVNSNWFLFETNALRVQINFCFIGHPSRSAVAFTAVTAAQTVSSKSPATPKKRTMSTLKAITAKLDKDDGDMKAKLSSFVFQFAQLLKTEAKNSDQVYSLDIYLCKVNNGNTRAICEIC